MIVPGIGSTIVGLLRPLDTTVDSPLLYLNDLLYTEPRMPEKYVLQLLAYDKQHRDKLKSLLMQYKGVFPTELPKRALSNCRLGDEIVIRLVPGREPIWQKIYR